MKLGVFPLETIISRQTVLSRRAILKLMMQGMIKINGVPATDLKQRVNIKKDRVVVDGQLISLRITDAVVYKLYKPKGMLSTCFDPANRITIQTILQKIPEPVVPVGRLDRETTGLILLTNDGDLSYKLTHPKFGCSKWYRVTVDQPITRAHVRRLQTGIMLEDGPAHFEAVEWVDEKILKVCLSEGRNRIIRRMFLQLGYTVTKLHRLSIGPIQLGKLGIGEFKKLTSAEFMTLVSSLGG